MYWPVLVAVVMYWVSEVICIDGVCHCVTGCVYLCLSVSMTVCLSFWPCLRWSVYVCVCVYHICVVYLANIKFDKLERKCRTFSLANSMILV